MACVTGRARRSTSLRYPTLAENRRRASWAGRRILAGFRGPDPVHLLSSRVPIRSVELLGESDEKPFRPPDVAKPIRVLISDYFAYELCAALAKPAKRLVDVVHGEHDAEVA